MTSTAVEVEAAPRINGLTFRRWRDDDHEVLAEIMNRSWAADGLDVSESPETTQPEDGSRLLESTVYDGQLGGRALLGLRGYAPTPELEAKITVRPTPRRRTGGAVAGRAAGAPSRPRAVAADLGVVLRGGPRRAGPAGGRRGGLPAVGAAMPYWEEHTLWQVAWDADEPVGMVLNVIVADENERFGRRRGYTEDVVVARRWRRHGGARALIARSLGVLKERGMTEAALGVYVNHPASARELYASLGYRTVRTAFTYRRPLLAAGEVDPL